MAQRHFCHILLVKATHLDSMWQVTKNGLKTETNGSLGIIFADELPYVLI